VPITSDGRGGGKGIRRRLTGRTLVMRNGLLMIAGVACGLSAGMLRADEPARGLDIYYIDTEGGAATLLVTPAGESVLIDCGNPGSRDADRIHQAATQLAGLKAIDHLVITHWHTDHY